MPKREDRARRCAVSAMLARARIGALASALAYIGSSESVAGEDPTGAAASVASESAVDSLAAFPDSVRSQRIAELTQQSLYADAQREARSFLAHLERTRGPESIEVARCLDLLVEALLDSPEVGADETIAIARRSLAIREKLLSPDDPERAFALTGLGMTLARRGEYAEARSILEQGLAVRERTLGGEHPLTLRSLSALGGVLVWLGDYRAASGVLERALSVGERVHGPESPALGPTLNNLGSVCYELGDLERGIGLYERLVRIFESAEGPESERVAMGLMGLGNIVAVSGDFAASRSHYERALAIMENAHGRESPWVAMLLGNMGLLMEYAGLLEEERALLERSLAIRESVFGPEHPEVAWTLKVLAQNAARSGRIAEARALHERSLAMQEKIVGQDNPEIAETVAGLADDCLRAGDAASARRHHERAVALLEAGHGPDNFKVGLGLLNLAGAIAYDEDVSAALPHYERASRILEAGLGGEHPWVGRAYAEHAAALAAAARDTEALALALRAEAIGREHVRRTIRTLPERQALGYLAERPSGLGLALDLAASGRAAGGDAALRVWDALVRSRALVLDELAMRRHAPANPGDGRDAVLVAAHAAAERRLALLSVRGEGGLAAETYRALLDSTRAVTESTERELLKASESFRNAEARAHLGFADVIARLPPEGALLAYARYAPPPIGAPAFAPGSRADGAYVALVARAPERDVAIVPIGAAATIDSLVAAWRSAASQPPALGDHEGDARCRTLGAALAEAIWSPVAPRLRDVGRLFVVPDGALALVNFAALPDGDSQFLVESGPTFTMLSAERDLVPAAPASPPGAGLLAMGDPDYDALDALADDGAVRTEREATTLVASRLRGESPRCRAFESIHWAPLPGTGEEIDLVARFWSGGGVDWNSAAAATPRDRARESIARTAPLERAVVLVGENATESAFKRSAPGRRLLHLATHGFVLGARCASEAAALRGLGGLVSEREAAASESASRTVTASVARDEAAPAPAGESGTASSVNPLLSAGLVFAGANHRASVGLDEGRDDGVLTAEEIAALDLSGVELAVISACETGVGEVVASEGVFGLRRAFRIAGVPALVTSLWPVGDDTTREWMKEFYRARRIAPATAEASRRASLERLRVSRAAGSDHPFAWAAFISTGG